MVFPQPHTLSHLFCNLTFMPTHIYKEKISEQPNQVVRRYEEKTIDNRQAEYRRSSSGSQALYVLLDILEVILAVRFLFKLLAANAASPFVNFVYNLSSPLVAPFRNIFSNTQTGFGVLEWSTIIAMIVYAIIAYLLAGLIENTSRPVTQ